MNRPELSQVAFLPLIISLASMAINLRDKWIKTTIPYNHPSPFIRINKEAKDDVYVNDRLHFC